MATLDDDWAIQQIDQFLHVTTQVARVHTACHAVAGGETQATGAAE